MRPAAAPRARPEAGLGHYVRDIVYGALDGCITTFAVVAGVAGAALSPRIAIVLGLANLAADGASMAASNYLGLKSELEQTGRSVRAERPWRHGMATFLAFVLAGAVPLAVFLLPLPIDPVVAVAVAASAVLAGVGAARARFIPGKPAWRQGLEMLLLGIAAGAAAYAVGAALRSWLPGA